MRNTSVTNQPFILHRFLHSMRVSRFKLILAVAICLAGLLGIWQIAAVVSKNSAPGLWIPAESLNLGTIWAQRALECTLPVYNSSDQEIEIEEPAGSCRCAEVQPKTLTIPPGGKQQISFIIKAAAGAQTPGQGARKELTMGLVAHLRRPQRTTISWTMRCLVRDWLLLSAPVIIIEEDANVLAPTHAFRKTVVPYHTAVPLESLEAVADSSDLQVALRQESATSGFIEIEPASHIPAGDFVRHIEFRPITISGEKLPPTLIQVKGKSVYDVYAVPAELVLGPLTLGAAKKSTVTLKSRTGREFSATSAPSPDDSRSLNETQREGQTVYEIEQGAAATGLQAKEVVFHVTSPESGSQELHVPLTYVGIAPDSQQ